ncbi:hypothetical protein D9613_007796 [Agrocybe pediades]|uniref:Cytoplasmic tRNA 2-thiolation protein 2 n=1 Tax=Agrocybe pediades TaxID=84607 RepID=A0A8H4QNB3_9AGAR|nr:hypothetical protein D9613_007796 [Agrocybe pediades]
MSSCENPNTDKDALMTRRQKFDGKTKICIKCKENQGSIVVRYAVYCKSCFFPLVQTRFRKTLEPTINPTPDGPRRKALKAGGSLALGLSGGTNSTALLDLVAKTYYASRSAEDDTGKGKIRGGTEHPRNSETVWKGRPAVCYVEVCGAFPTEEDRIESIRNIVNRYTDANFEFVPLRLEDAFDPSWWQSIGGGDLTTSARSLGLALTNEDLLLVDATPQCTSLEALRAYLASLPTKTAFYSAIQILIRLLLLHTAAARKASHLLLGTSLTSLSINLISGIAQGAGFAVAAEAKEEWTPRLDSSSSTIRVIRPLRDVGMKECAIWNWWCGVPVAGKCRSMYGGGASAIGALTRDFIVGLETDYPATVSTIARTCSKLSPKEGIHSVCILCERPAQYGIQEWKAQISIRSYHNASGAVTGNTRPPHLSEDEIASLTKSDPYDSSSSSPLHSLTPHLCYACHTLLTSRSSRGTAALTSAQESDKVTLPLWTRSTLDHLNQHHASATSISSLPKWKMSQSEMREQIKDFLLPDEG